jgi:hypothetical protein
MADSADSTERVSSSVKSLPRPAVHAARSSAGEGVKKTPERARTGRTPFPEAEEAMEAEEEAREGGRPGPSAAPAAPAAPPVAPRVAPPPVNTELGRRRGLPAGWNQSALSRRVERGIDAKRVRRVMACSAACACATRAARTYAAARMCTGVRSHARDLLRCWAQQRQKEARVVRVVGAAGAAWRLPATRPHAA